MIHLNKATSYILLAFLFVGIQGTAQVKKATVVATVNTPIYPDTVRKGVAIGLLPMGGTSGNGAIFSYSVKAGLKTLASFQGGTGGGFPNQGTYYLKNGDIIGTFRADGDPLYNSGGIFYYTAATKTIASVHNFQSGAGGQSPPVDGATPLWGLALAAGSTNTFYGTASQGGLAPGNGEIFKFNLNNGYSYSHYLNDNAEQGHFPFSGLATNVNNGTEIGTTIGFGSGTDPNGTVFSYDPKKKVMTTLYNFTNGPDGEWPQVTPTMAYGLYYIVTTIQNGSLFAGAITAGNPTTKAAQVIHTLNGSADGYGLNTPLVLGSDNNIYGVATYGGDAANPQPTLSPVGDGTLFRINSGGQFTVLMNFGGSLGSHPTSIVQIAPREFLVGTQSGSLVLIQP